MEIVEEAICLVNIVFEAHKGPAQHVQFVIVNFGQTHISNGTLDSDLYFTSKVLNLQIKRLQYKILLEIYTLIKTHAKYSENRSRRKDDQKGKELKEKKTKYERNFGMS